MTTINTENVREEICHLIRNSDVFTFNSFVSTTIRGVTTASQSFTATASQTVFTLTNANVKNIRSCTVNSVAKLFLRDFTMNWNTGVLTLNTGATLNDPVVIQYDYGTTDKIYPDLPRTYLTRQQYSRVGIQLVNASTNPFGLGGMTQISDAMVQITVWMPADISTSANGIGGTNHLQQVITNIRHAMRDYAKSFYTMPYVYPMSIGPQIGSSDQKIIQQNQDFNCKFIVENN